MQHLFKGVLTFLLILTHASSAVLAAPVGAFPYIAPEYNDPIDVQFLAQLGMELFDRRDYAGADEMFRKLVRIDPGNQKALRYIGEIDRLTRTPYKKGPVLTDIAHVNQDLERLQQQALTYERRNRDLEFAVGQLINQNDNLYSNLVTQQTHTVAQELNSLQSTNSALNTYQQQIIDRDRQLLAQNNELGHMRTEIKQVNQMINQTVHTDSSAILGHELNKKDQHIDILNTILRQKRSHMVDKVLTLVEKMRELEYFRNQLARIKQNMTTVQQQEQVDTKKLAAIKHELSSRESEFTDLKNRLVQKDQKINNINTHLFQKDKELVDLKETVQFISDNLHDVSVTVSTIDQQLKHSDSGLILLRQNLNKVRQKLNDQEQALIAKDRELDKLKKANAATLTSKTDKKKLQELSSLIKQKDGNIQEYKLRLDNLNKELDTAKKALETKNVTPPEVTMKITKEIESISSDVDQLGQEGIVNRNDLIGSLSMRIRATDKKSSIQSDIIDEQARLTRTLGKNLDLIDDENLLEELTHAQEKQINALKKSLNAKKQESSSQSQQISHLETELAQLREQMKHQSSEYTQELESVSAANNQYINGLKKAVDSYEDKINESSKHIASYEHKISSIEEKQNQKISQLINKKELELKALKENLLNQNQDIVKLNDDLWKYKMQAETRWETIESQERDINTLKKKISKLEENLKEKDYQIHAKDVKAVMLKNKLADSEDKIGRQAIVERKLVLMQQDLEKTLRAIDAKESLLSDLAKQLNTKNTQLHLKDQQVGTLESQILDHQQQLVILKNQYENDEDYLWRLESYALNLKSKLTNATDVLDTKKRDLALMEEDLRQHKQKMISKETDLSQVNIDKQKLRSRLESAFVKINEKDNLISDTKQKLATAHGNLKESNITILKNQKIIDDLYSRVKDLQLELAAQDQQVQRERQKFNDLKSELNTVKNSFDSNSSSIESKDQEIQELNLKLDQAHLEWKEKLNQAKADVEKELMKKQEKRNAIFVKKEADLNKKIEDLKLLRAERKNMNMRIINQQKEEIASLQLQIKKIHSERNEIQQQLNESIKDSAQLKKKINTQLSSLNGEKEKMMSIEDTISSLKNKITFSEKEIIEKDKIIAEKDAALLSANKSITEKSILIEKLTKEVSIQQMRITATSNDLKTATSTIQDLRQSLIKQGDLLKRQTFTNNDDALSVYKARLADEKTRFKNLMQDFNFLKNSLNTQTADVKSKQKEIGKLQKMIDTLKAAPKDNTSAKLKNVIEDKKTIINELQEKLKNQNADQKTMKNVYEQKLKKAESSLEQSMAELKQTLSELESFKSKAQWQEDKISTLQAQIDLLQQEIPAQQKLLEEEHQKFNKLQDQWEALNQTIEKKETDLNQKSTLITHLKEELKTYKQTVKSLPSADKAMAQQEKINDQQEFIKNLNDEIKTLQQQLKDAPSKQVLADKIESITQHKLTVETLKKEIKELNITIKKTASIQNDLLAKQDLNDAQKQKLEALEESLENLKSDLTSKEKKIKKLAADYQKDLRAKSATISSQGKTIKALNDKLEKAESEIDRLKRELAQAKANMNDIKRESTKVEQRIKDTKMTVQKKEKEIETVKQEIEHIKHQAEIKIDVIKTTEKEAIQVVEDWPKPIPVFDAQ